MRIDESWYIKPESKNFPTAVASGGVVIRKTNGRLLIALLRDKKFSNYMLPKGKVEGGESEIEGARREIKEETGLSDLKHISTLGKRERLNLEKNEWRRTKYFLFTTDKISGQQELKKGEEEYIMGWFDLDNLPPIFWPEQEEIIIKNKERIKKLLLG